MYFDKMFCAVFNSFAPFLYYWVKLKNAFLKLFGNDSSFSLLSIGILNGFLSCSFVYIALVDTLASGRVGKGMLYMFFLD